MTVSSFLLDLVVNTMAISLVATLLFLLERFLSWKVLYYIWVIFVLKSLLIFRYKLSSFITYTAQSAGLSTKAQAIAFNSEKYVINSINNTNYYYFNIIIYTLFFIWLAGCVGFFLFSIIRYRAYINSFKNESPIIEDFPLKVLETAKCEMRIKSKVKMIYSNKLTSPLVTGIFRYKIVIPPSFFKAFSFEECVAVLSHELQHIKRHDLILNFLLLLSNAIHWFNPIVWVAMKKIKQTQEICCDATTCDFYSYEKKHNYCVSLIKFLESSSTQQVLPIGLNLLTNFSETKRRISMLLTSNKVKKLNMVVSSILLIISLSLFSATSFAFGVLKIKPANIAKIVGNPNAKVQIVEFGDYQCSFCSEAAPVIDKIMLKYQDKISWTFKDFPLGFHENATAAAKVANCAAKQNKFYEMHLNLLENFNKLNNDLYINLSEKLGLNAKEMEACRNNPETYFQIEQDIKEGLSLGINGVPSFIINNIPYQGGISIEEFSKIIDKELAK